MAVSRRLRFEILRRDNYTCRYCGAKAPDVALQVDHVTPVALGGSDEPTNLVTSCTECNSGKASSSPDAELVEDVSDTAAVFADAIEIAVQRRREREDASDAEVRRFREWWDTYTYVNSDDKIPLPTAWEATIERFLTLGLTLEDLFKFTDQAMGARLRRGGPHGEFRYFCGIAWNVVKDITEEAARITEGGDE